MQVTNRVVSYVLISGTANVAKMRRKRTGSFVEKDERSNPF